MACCSKARIQMKRAATLKAKKTAMRNAAKGITPKKAAPKKASAKKGKVTKAQPCKMCGKK